MPPNVRQLMYSVALLTTRSENWLELLGGVPPILENDQLKEYDPAQIERVPSLV